MKLKKQEKENHLVIIKNKKKQQEEWNFNNDMNEKKTGVERAISIRSKIQVTKLVPKSLENCLKTTIFCKSDSQIFNPERKTPRIRKNDKIILFIGGAQALFPSLEIYEKKLRIISKKLNASVWFLHYSQITAKKYPEQINEVLLFYKSVLWFLKMRLKRKKLSNEIMIIGESLGGTLVSGMLNHLIISNFPKLPSKIVYISSSKLDRPKLYLFSL